MKDLRTQEEIISFWAQGALRHGIKVSKAKSKEDAKMKMQTINLTERKIFKN